MPDAFGPRHGRSIDSGITMEKNVTRWLLITPARVVVVVCLSLLFVVVCCPVSHPNPVVQVLLATLGYSTMICYSHDLGLPSTDHTQHRRTERVVRECSFAREGEVPLLIAPTTIQHMHQG